MSFLASLTRTLVADIRRRAPRGTSPMLRWVERPAVALVPVGVTRSRRQRGRSIQ